MRLERRQVAYNYDIRNRSIQYIIIHGTATPGATAENEFTLHNRADRGASAEIFIDDKQAIEIMNSDKYNAWAIGVGNKGMGAVHDNSINIEMCVDNNGRITNKTFLNTVDITKQLMKKYNIPISRVLRHRDVCYKECPTQLIAGSWVAWDRWDEFKNKLVEEKEEELDVVVVGKEQNFKRNDERVKGQYCYAAIQQYVYVNDADRAKNYGRDGYILKGKNNLEILPGQKLKMYKAIDENKIECYPEGLGIDPLYTGVVVYKERVAIPKMLGDSPVKVIEKEVIKEVIKEVPAPVTRESCLEFLNKNL